MSLREYVGLELNRLDETRLKQVAWYLDFLRYKNRRSALSTPHESEFASLYAEFADEDRVLAEEEMEEYAILLKSEDAA